MTTYGLSSTGFVPKPASVIQAEIEAAQIATIDPALDVSAESPIGQLNAVVVTKLAEVWQLADATYKARDPNGATQAQLDVVCALTGTTREGPTAGTVRLRLSVNAHTLVPAGSAANVTGQAANRWALLEAADNSAGASPTTIEVRAQATQTGAIQALAGTITTIATPVSGWTAVTNPLDAVEGHDLETDAQLRSRRQAELEAAGTSPVDAIRADLLDPQNADVIAAAFVEENASGTTDAFGRPPHTVEAVVQFVAGLSSTDLEAARQRVAALLWAAKAGGIATYGGVQRTILDSLGQPRVVRWSEPTLVPIAVLLELGVVPAQYAGATAVLDAILAFGAALTLGRPVVLAKLEAAVVNLPGVTDVLSLKLGTSGLTGPLAAQNVGIAPRELAVFDTGRITLTTEPPT